MLNMYTVINDDISSDCVCHTSCYLHSVSAACITGAVKTYEAWQSDGVTSDYSK